MKKIFFSMVMMLCLSLYANAQYKVGDIYDKGGVKGVVVIVDKDGEHGLIMSLKGSGKRWSKNDAKVAVGAVDENDGAVNMKAVAKFIKNNNLSWSDFPLFEWVKELGEGWYIPSKNELQAIAENINGGSLDEYNQKNFKKFDKIINKNKGKSMIAKGMAKSNDFLSMDSSTETVGNMVYTLRFTENTGSKLTQMALGRFASRKGKLEFSSGLKTFNGGGKIANHYSRAVHKF